MNYPPVQVIDPTWPVPKQIEELVKAADQLIQLNDAQGRRIIQLEKRVEKLERA